MIGELAVFYLFLGGVGAGTVAVCSLADLLWVRRPFGSTALVHKPSVAAEARTLDYGFLAGLIILATGTACLVLDLGRADRVLTLFLAPRLSVMSVGAYALLSLLVLGAFLVLTSLFYLPEISRRVVSAAEIAAIIIGVAVMVYTGVLLATVGGVSLWWSALLPALFLLSSVSGGIAVVLALSAVAEDCPRLATLSRNLALIDMAVIALEVLVAAAFLWESARDPNPGTIAGLAILTQGSAAKAWWLGFGIFGLALPLVIEALTGGFRLLPRRALALAAVAVLLGAFCLRWSVVEAGVHREPVLEEPGLEYPFWN